MFDNMSLVNPTDLILGYLTLWSNPDQSIYIGGILAIDVQGYPIDYSLTVPIEISRAQRIFYGNSLHRYLITKVIGDNIILSLEKKPTFIIVSEDDLLSIRDVVDIPVLKLNLDDGETEKPFTGLKSDLEIIGKISKGYLKLDLQEPFMRLEKVIVYFEELREAED
ncbi:hypothetical protein MCGE09_00321 [Thaumarchaeota archaeon SCGC AB-539-E09]|nr:hypothetical protein MCGE09_00321 [Thaumarchaeota archaeon SCGC AB-539-E09]